MADGSTTAGKLYQGVARNEFGFKMLAQMGWSEGQARILYNWMVT